MSARARLPQRPGAAEHRTNRHGIPPRLDMLLAGCVSPLAEGNHVGMGWRVRAEAVANQLSQSSSWLKTLTAQLAWLPPWAHSAYLESVDSTDADGEVDLLLAHLLAQVRWVTIAALLVLTVAQPIIGRVGLPTWALMLFFAGYSWGIRVARPHVPWLHPAARIALVDLLAVGLVYAISASPGGPLFVLVFLIAVCAATTVPFTRAMLYTGGVLLAIAVISPTLPRWSHNDAAIRELLARLIIVALASITSAILVRRLREEHRSARSSREQAERQTELNRLRTVFVSTISHDLRTPLTAMRAGLGLLEMSLHDRIRPDEEQLLTAARRNSERLRLLIDDLLAYNQLESGMLRFTYTPLDLGAVVTAAVSTLRPLLDEKRQSVAVELTGPLPVEGDPRRLEQVLVNVVANAHQHTPAGTKIRITSAATPLEVDLTVSDDGPGIPAAELERIFLHFDRLAPADGGAGLGLAIAWSIVARHGGRMWAESDVGRGTTMHIVLPITNYADC